MQSSDIAPGIRVNCLYYISVRSGMLETNKQTLLFNFREDQSYFFDSSIQITRFDKIYDDFVNDPMKGDFQTTLLLF